MVTVFSPLKIFCLTKLETSAKIANRVPKLGYKGGHVRQLSIRGTFAASGAGGVVCNILF